MNKYEICNRLFIRISCETIEYVFTKYNTKTGEVLDFSRKYKSTPKRVAWVIFASNKYQHYTA